MSAQEIELKLRVAPDDMPRLRAAKRLADSAGKAGSKMLDSTYFDTDDLRLQAQGLSLRVRKQGRSFVQTLKSAPTGQGGALRRGEWETPVSGDQPDLSALPDPSVLLDAVGPLEAAALRPVFSTHVRRSVRLLTPADGVEVEVAIDEGEIRTPSGRTLPLSELELELKAGTDTAPLYALAQALNETVPLRVETRTKSERGYDLAAGLGARWSKASRLELSPEITVEQALAGIVRHCIGHMVANEAVALEGVESEGVHQMRVALRRLRSALSLFKPFLPPEQLDRLVAEVKWLAGSLGAARDWDVFLEELLVPVLQAFPGDAGLAALEEAAGECRRRGYAGVRAAVDSPRYTALLLTLGAWVDGRGWRDQPVSEHSAMLLQPVLDMADRMLSKRHRQARRRGRGFARLAAADRHQLRIALKKLRYAAEFFRSLYDPKPVRRYLDDLAALQDTLGHLQDVATVTKLVGQVEAELGDAAPAGWQRGAGMVIGWHGHGLQAREPQIVRDWEAFADTKPFWTSGKPDPETVAP